MNIHSIGTSFTDNTPPQYIIWRHRLFAAGSGNPDEPVTAYPRHLLELRGGRAEAWDGEQHAHTRAYLDAFLDGGVAVLPPQFFEKLKRKGQSEVLRPLAVAAALERLRARHQHGGPRGDGDDGQFVPPPRV